MIREIKIIVVSIFCVINLHSFAQKEDFNKISKKSYSGDWTCVSIVHDVRLLFTDDGADYYHYFPLGNLQIIGSEVSLFDYPCQFHSTYKLKSKGGVFSLSSEDPEVFVFQTLSLRNDTLVLESFTDGMTKMYIRDTFDKTIITQLKKDWLNPECLSGKWCLIDTETGDDGSEHEHLPGVALPDTLDADRKNYKTEGKYLILEVDGKEREFEIRFYYNFFFRNQRFELKLIDGTKEEKAGEIVYGFCAD